MLIKQENHLVTKKNIHLFEADFGGDIPYTVYRFECGHCITVRSEEKDCVEQIKNILASMFVELNDMFEIQEVKHQKLEETN